MGSALDAAPDSPALLISRPDGAVLWQIAANRATAAARLR
jgi:hypothetical protein